MRPFQLLCAACLACWLEPTAVGARQSESPAYPTLVAAYRGGRLGAVDVVMALPDRLVAKAVDEAIAPTPGWGWEDLRAAALLHTDAWYSELSHKRAGRANVQLEHAKELLARAVRLEPTLADYAQRWFDLVVLLLRKHGTAMQLENFHNPGRLLFPLPPAREKAIPFVRRGITAEYAGSTKGLVMSPSTREHMAGVSFEIRSWVDAAMQFSQALALDRTYHLAALHLGRLRMLQGNRTEAAQQFSDAARAHDARVAYLASLFLGALAERDGRYDEAERLYRSARDRYPSAQAAPLALSQLLSRMSREAEAREVLAAFLTERRGRVVDPLWTYIPSPVVEVDDMLATLAELRAEVMK